MGFTNRRMALISAIKKSRLPSEYQEVEYLENTGTQFINTGFIVTSDDVVIVTEFQKADTSGDAMIFGINNVGDIRLNINAWNSNGDTRLYVRFLKETGGDGIHTNDYRNYFMLLTLSKTAIVIDETTYSISAGSGVSFTNNQQKLCVFAKANNAEGTSATYYLRGRIKKFSVSYGNEPQLDLVPCYRKSDSVAGMYDVVRNVFLTNAGSGTFTVGDDV